MVGWIGVDLDGTLAQDHGWTRDGGIGPPVAPMLARVKRWLKEDREVRIVTARVSGHPAAAAKARREIERWLKEHLSQTLPITNRKDHLMIELWDDRAVQVRKNKGEPVDLARRKD